MINKGRLQRQGGDYDKFEAPLGVCQWFRGITIELPPDSGQGPEVIQERCEAGILKMVTPIAIDRS
jgi:hypothetical protein